MIRRWCKLIGQQSGISVMELVVGLLVMGVLAFGASMATIQVLQQARTGLASAEGVRGTQTIVANYIYGRGGGGAPVVRKQVNPPVVEPSVLWMYGIVALNGDIELKKVTVKSYPGEAENAPEHGDIYAKGDIYLSVDNGTETTVTGSAVYTGTLEIGKKSSVGTDVPIDEPQVFPQPDIDAYKALAQAGGTHIGNLSIGSTQTIASQYITGNLTISNNSGLIITGTVWVDGTITCGNRDYIVGPGTIVAVGNISAGNKITRIPITEMPLIVSKSGNITLKNSGEIAAILYAPNGIVTLGNNGNIYGSIVAESINITGNNTVITYPVALRETSRD